MNTRLGALAALAGFAAAAASADPLADRAARYRVELRDSILPYWFDTAQDASHGGYTLADAGSGPGPAKEKMIVSQARMVWTFSLAHRLGFSTAQRDHLKAAAQGYCFLAERFFDRDLGGCFWTTEPDGRPRNPRKMMYGHAFVLYALVEFHRAGGGREPLDRALDLFRVMQARAHDPEHGGWTEHFERDWTPLPLRSPDGQPEVAGLKSANTHLHLMEAFTELFRATGDPAVKAALEESLRINKTWFYPRDPGRSCFHRNPDWTPVTDPRSAGLSYGHNVEFGWLMIEAERALGFPPSWEHARAHVDHALAHGWDSERGGLHHRGTGDAPADDLKKVWWVQAEMMAALTELLVHRREPALEAPLLQLVGFVDRHMADPRDGVWVDSVNADGSPLRRDKAHNWKANYHDVRAIAKFVEAFAPR